jgi:hypothetical protein
MIICRRPTRSTVRNTLVRVLLPVRIGINYTGRPCARSSSNRRPVYIYSIVMNINGARPAGVINSIDLRTLTRIPLDILNPRASNISAVVPGICIIYNSSIVYNIYYPGMWHIIIINIGPVYISLRRAYPIIIRHIISAAKTQAYAYTRS